jgi:hypothetical protein
LPYFFIAAITPLAAINLRIPTATGTTINLLTFQVHP